ncbi:hypothetical protein BASA81_001259 [Batrachochytrium salamandrivorans]|nr:hypothetical protein BASA81_001259 [Batrachochytrium salamandrivorans]
MNLCSPYLVSVELAEGAMIQFASPCGPVSVWAHELTFVLPNEPSSKLVGLERVHLVESEGRLMVGLPPAFAEAVRSALESEVEDLYVEEGGVFAAEDMVWYSVSQSLNLSASPSHRASIRGGQEISGRALIKLYMYEGEHLAQLVVSYCHFKC